MVARFAFNHAISVIDGLIASRSGLTAARDDAQSPLTWRLARRSSVMSASGAREGGEGAHRPVACSAST